MIGQTIIFAVLLLIMWTIVILLVWQDGREKKGTAMKDNDLISRSALCEKLQAHKDFFVNAWRGFGNLPPKDKVRVDEITHCIAETMNAPAVDAVEVVRCKDCKHFCPYEGEEHKGDCAELAGLESCVYEDDFCSYGERRADDGSR